MPHPEIRETEKDFLHRCIPELIHEGRPRSQSIAVCFSIYRREGTEAKSPKPEKKKTNYYPDIENKATEYTHGRRVGRRRGMVVGSQLSKYNSGCEQCDKKLRYTCCDMLENI